MLFSGTNHIEAEKHKRGGKTPGPQETDAQPHRLGIVDERADQPVRKKIIHQHAERRYNQPRHPGSGEKGFFIRL